MTTESPEIISSIREILIINPQIKEKRKELKELEDKYSYHRDILKEKYGNNTIIHTSVGDITIREKTTDGKLSLEDVRELFDTIDWVGKDTKTRIIEKMETLCISKRKYCKTLTVRKSKRKHNKTTKKKNKINDLSGDTIL
jgi:hypothetical protein